MSWRWVDPTALTLLHEESLAEHGGASGLRDPGLLESALTRPLNLANYGEPDFAALAACYGVALAKNHAFIDGNKRAAFLAIGLFLHLNGYRLHATQAETTMVVMGVASGEVNEAALGAWLREHCAKR